MTDRLQLVGPQTGKSLQMRSDKTLVVEKPQKKGKFYASSDSENWFTPVEIIQAARNTLGAIDLDPASCEEANEKYVEANHFFTRLDDGLAQSWEDYVNFFVNPPYGQRELLDGKIVPHRFILEDDEGGIAVSQQRLWLEKAINEYEAGHVEAGIILVSNNTSEKWFEPAFNYPICFPRKRIHFFKPGGSRAGSPTKGNALIYMGPERDVFIDQFSQFGAVVERAKING